MNGMAGKAAAAAAALMIGAAQAGAATQVNISIGDSGYWGAIPMMNGLRPDVWNTTPIVAIGAAIAGASILYLNVPEAQRRDWRHYCSRYDACGRPVRFVKNNWYRDHYAPEYRRQHPAAMPPARDARGPAPQRPGPGMQGPGRMPPGQAKKGPDRMPPGQAKNGPGPMQPGPGARGGDHMASPVDRGGPQGRGPGDRPDGRR